MKYTLYAMPTTEANIEKAGRYEFMYSCADHILIASAEAPKGAKEVTPEMQNLLTADDWDWINKVRAAIRERTEIEYAQDIKKAQDKFFERFKANLEKAAEENSDGQLDTEN